MRTLYVCFVLLLGLIGNDVLAGEIRKVKLTDGSIIQGEVLSLKNGVYTLKSGTLGTIKVEESKILSITSVTSTQMEIQALQQLIMKDKELLNIILPLQNDPDFKKAMQDPSIMEAINAGDMKVLLSNPRFMKLLTNPKILDIQDKIKK